MNKIKHTTIFRKTLKHYHKQNKQDKAHNHISKEIKTSSQTTKKKGWAEKEVTSIERTYRAFKIYVVEDKLISS